MELHVEGRYELIPSPCRRVRPVRVVAVLAVLLGLALVVYVILWGARPAYDPWWPVFNN